MLLVCSWGARERGAVDTAAGAAREGAGGVLLVSGEPGVGKTRLAEWAAGVAAAGMRRGWGWASEDEGSPPYWPFRLAMRGVEGIGPVVFDAPLPDRRAETVAQERFRLFEAVTDVLRSAAEPAGLLLVLDDMQWADPASLGLLVHLARGVADSRLFVLVNYRDTETSGTQPLLNALAALTREAAVTRLHLDGLSEAEVAEQLTQVTGWAVPGPVAAAVCARTRGNPLFVHELGRVLAESSDGALPDGVRDAVRGRLARLAPECRSLVASAAVLGSELEPAALAGATGRDLGAVLAALDEASKAGIIGPDRRFAHDLIREAARIDVPTATRLALHHALAEHLAGCADADRRVAEIAHHRLEALPAGDPVAVVDVARRASAEAMAHLAWEEADGFLRRALDGGGAPPDVRCELLIARAEAQIRGYDIEGARTSVLAAAGIGRVRGDAATIADAVLTMEGVTDFVWDDTGRGLCEQALAGIPASDSAVRARLLAMLVVADTWRSLADAKPRAAEALAMAERVAERRAVIEALRASHIAHSGPDGVHDRLAFGDRLLVIGADGDDDARLWGHLWRFDALAQLGDVDGAEAEVGDDAGAAGLAAALGLPPRVLTHRGLGPRGSVLVETAADALAVIAALAAPACGGRPVDVGAAAQRHRLGDPWVLDLVAEEVEAAAVHGRPAEHPWAVGLAALDEFQEPAPARCRVAAAGAGGGGRGLHRAAHQARSPSEITVRNRNRWIKGGRPLRDPQQLSRSSTWHWHLEPVPMPGGAAAIRQPSPQPRPTS